MKASREFVVTFSLGTRSAPATTLIGNDSEYDGLMDFTAHSIQQAKIDFLGEEATRQTVAELEAFIHCAVEMDLSARSELRLFTNHPVRDQSASQQY